MYQLFKAGVTHYNMPRWVEVVIFADKLRTPPWEIAEGGDRMLWMIRYNFVMREKARAANNAN